MEPTLSASSPFPTELKLTLDRGSCFAAGTSVIVGVSPDGSPITRRIEEIQAGDRVLSRDQDDENDALEARQVTRVFHKTSDHLRVLTIAGDDGNVEVIRTTDEHPFYVRNRGWVGAGDLAVGDVVQENDGTWQAVLGSERQAFAGGITVYNLEVAGDHTYFVEDGAGAGDAVWVHNTCEDVPELNINKIQHVFGKPEHNPGRLVSAVGGEARARPVTFTDIGNLIVDAAYSESSGAGDDAISIGGDGARGRVRRCRSFSCGRRGRIP